MYKINKEFDARYDEYIWIKWVMRSCLTQIQLVNANKLIDLFTKKYNDKELSMELTWYGYQMLEEKL